MWKTTWNGAPAGPGRQIPEHALADVGVVLELLRGDRSGLLPDLQLDLALVVGDRAEGLRAGVGGHAVFAREQVRDVPAGPDAVGLEQRVIGVDRP